MIDPATKQVTAPIPAIAPWTEHEEWQQPGPAIKVAGHLAYVTDQANRKLVVVDLEARAVSHTIELDHQPTEIAVTTGLPLDEHHHG